MKKYKLLKDLPGYSAGEVFANEELEIRKYYASNGTGKSFSIFSMGLGELPEWFEEIKEDPYWCEHGINRVSSVPCRLCPKPAEKEGCKHENEIDPCACACWDCREDLHGHGTKSGLCPKFSTSKQLPSNEIGKDVEKFIRGGISPEYARYSAIVRFLDEHFKY